MDGKAKLKDFPHVQEKLNAPKKLSGFERQRQEAESKRLREEAENEAAMRAFVDDFGGDADDDDDPISAIARGGDGRYGGDVPTGPRGVSGAALGGPRHFAASTMKNGPGSLGPPPTMKMKREMEEQRERDRDRDRKDREARAFDDYDEDRRRKSPEPAVRRPTMLLSCLPKVTTESVVQSWMPSAMKVEQVTFQRSPTSALQRSLSAIVTLSPDTPKSEVDSAVGALSNRYLGFGLYLKISRHVSTSGGPAASLQNINNLNDQQPFGAKSLPRAQPSSHSMRNAPPPDSFNQPSYTQPGFGQYNQGPAPLFVAVSPPSDLKLLRIIHKTVERLVEYGPHFEAVLMSRPEVQHDENFGWLFDNTSQGGVYYRWLVWEYFSSKTAQKDSIADQTSITPWTAEDDFAQSRGLFRMYDNGPLWQLPVERPKYEHVVDFEDLVEDSGYQSSEDESGDEGVRKQYHGGQGQVALDDNSSTTAKYLNPYRKAKFTHLLARLPVAIAKLRTGDVARVTNFVINNAGQGAEEIVDMLLTNAEHPFSRIVAYTDDSDPDSEDLAKESNDASTEAKKKEDSKLIALYLISDVLQASSTSGVRDAWKYRALFQSALKARKTFEHLGRLEKELQWGKMKAEQWKRKVNIVLSLWNVSNLFPGEAQKTFKESFENPLPTEEEVAEKERVEEEERAKRESLMWKSAEEMSQTRDVAQPAPSVEQEKAPELQHQQPPPEQKRPKQNRPTAEDLIAAADQPPAKPPLSLGNFSMSLSTPKTSESNRKPSASLGSGFSLSLGGGGATKTTGGSLEGEGNAKSIAGNALDEFDDFDEQ